LQARFSPTFLRSAVRFGRDHYNFDDAIDFTTLGGLLFGVADMSDMLQPVVDCRRTTSARVNDKLKHIGHPIQKLFRLHRWRAGMTSLPCD